LKDVIAPMSCGDEKQKKKKTDSRNVTEIEPKKKKKQSGRGHAAENAFFWPDRSGNNVSGIREGKGGGPHAARSPAGHKWHKKQSRKKAIGKEYEGRQASGRKTKREED